MAMYYSENKIGTLLSYDGKLRFIQLCGREAYDYLRSAEGKKKRFMKTSTREDGGEEEYVEVPLAYMRKHRKDERHRQYVSDTRNESGSRLQERQDRPHPYKVRVKVRKEHGRLPANGKNARRLGRQHPV